MGLRQLLTSFEGRIGRKSFWLGTLICIGAALLGSVVIDPGVWTADPPRAPAPALALWDIAWVIPQTAVSVKRFNDRDWAHWFGYVPGIIGIGLIMAEQRGFLVDPERASAGDWLLLAGAVAVLVLALIDNGFLKGTQGGNRYGPDPLQA